MHGSARKPGAPIPPPPLELDRLRRDSEYAAPMVRRRAAVALRRARDLEGLAILMGMAGDPDAFTRKQAAWSMGVVGHRLGHDLPTDTRERVLGLLRGREADDNARVRDFALYARARLGEPAARRAIPAILADEGRSQLRRQHGREALEDGGGVP